MIYYVKKLVTQLIYSHIFNENSSNLLSLTIELLKKKRKKLCINILYEKTHNYFIFLDCVLWTFLLYLCFSFFSIVAKIIKVEQEYHILQFQITYSIKFYKYIHNNSFLLNNKCTTCRYLLDGNKLFYPLILLLII